MKKVVITDYQFDDVNIERQVLARPDIQVFDYHYRDPENILKVARDADAIIIQMAKFPAELISQLERCKIIAKYASGYDGIDLDAATKKGIYVTNIREYCTEEVSTHTLALLLDLSRRVNLYNSWTHSGRWYGVPGVQHSLKDQTVGIIGFGKIAKSFVRKLQPLCNNIWVYSSHTTEEEAAEYGIKLKSFDEICVNADYISIHCPLTEKTRNLFNKEVFRLMKKDAKIINMARGPVVNEDDLIWALENNEIDGAALDVMCQEPAPPDHPLFRFENVLITPHTGWYSEESFALMKTIVAQDVLRVLDGKLPLNIVNKEILK